MIIIRPANAYDREDIRRIYEASIGEAAVPNAAYRDELIRSGGVLVAQVGKEIAGFGGIDVQAREHLKWLYFLPEHQGAGLGSKMLKELEAIGWQSGLQSLRVHSAPDAVEFYRKHGYRAAEESAKLEHDHEGIEMIKDRGVDEMQTRLHTRR